MPSPVAPKTEQEPSPVALEYEVLPAAPRTKHVCFNRHLGAAHIVLARTLCFLCLSECWLRHQSHSASSLLASLPAAPSSPSLCILLTPDCVSIPQDDLYLYKKLLDNHTIPDLRGSSDKILSLFFFCQNLCSNQFSLSCRIRICLRPDEMRVHKIDIMSADGLQQLDDRT